MQTATHAFSNITIIGDNTTVTVVGTEEKSQGPALSDPISNCYPHDFTYHARIQLDEKIGSIKKGKVQVLHGTIGTGKSSAALHFIDRSKEKFTVRWRVNCSEDEESINSCLTELARKLRVVTDTSFSRLFQAIKKKAEEENIIFLLDKVQEKPCGTWLKELWQIKDSLYIMATTNNANLDLDFPCEKIPVDKFDEAIQFLKDEEQIKRNKDEDLKELCEYFSWNVLGLTAAKIYITKMKIPVKRYLQMQRNKTAAIQVRKTEQRNQNRTLYTAVRTCLEEIDEAHFPVVAAISLIAHENIAEFLLSELFPGSDAPTRSAYLNDLLEGSFLINSLVHITTENNVRFLSFHKFTQSVIRDLLDEDQDLRKDLIRKMAGILVKYFRKDNRYKKGHFMQRIMVSHVEEFLKQCQDDLDDRILIASARLSELVAFAYTQGQEALSEHSLRIHFQRSEDILHKLCGVTTDDFRVNPTCQETDIDLQSLGIRGSDIAVAQRLFEKLTEKSSKLSNAIVQELAFSRPLSSADLSLFPVEVRNNEELKEKVDSFEPLSNEDLELLISKGVAYSADDYHKLFLPELYSSMIYSFGRNYFYLRNKQSIEDANLYINRLKLAYCISREISKRMKPGEAVMHEYLAQCNALLYLLVNGESIDENGCIKPKETKAHCKDLTNAIKHYQILSQDERQFFEMGVLKKKNDDRYSLLVCHHQIVHCYLQLISPDMTSSSEERDQYIRDGAKHCDILLELLNTKIPKDVNEQVTKSPKYFNLIGDFFLATNCARFLHRAWHVYTVSAKNAEEEKGIPYVQAITGSADVLSRFGKQCFVAAQISNRQLKHSNAMEKFRQIQLRQPHFAKKVLLIKERNESSIENYFAQLWRRERVKPIQDTDRQCSQIPGTTNVHETGKEIHAEENSVENVRQTSGTDGVSSSGAGRVDSGQYSPLETDDDPLSVELNNELKGFDQPDQRQRLAQKIPREWIPLARFLEVPDEKIGEIAVNNPGNVVEQAYQMLLYWWTSRGVASVPWSESLGKALCAVGRNDLAKEFADYSAPDEPTE